MVLDSFALTGRVAFVTGAGSGIGQRLAAAFAEAGADVACFDRDQEAARRTAAEIKAIGRHAAVFGADVTDAGAVSEAVTRAVDALGRADLDPAGARANCRQQRERRSQLPREMVHAEVRAVGAELFGGNGQVDRLQQRVRCRPRTRAG